MVLIRYLVGATDWETRIRTFLNEARHKRAAMPSFETMKTWSHEYHAHMKRGV